MSKYNATYANIQASPTAKEKCVRGIAMMMRAVRLRGNMGAAETMRIQRKVKVMA